MLEYFPGHGAAFPIFIICVALVATFFAMTRILPAQNVFAALGLIAAFTALIQTVGEKLGVPFGPFFYTENLGPPIFYLVPWPVIAVWIVAILNSRGTAALILRPWRDAPKYGFMSLTLTAALTVIFDAALEPYAARTHHFWVWQTQKPFLAWYGAPWVNFASRFAVTLILVACATPWLIGKKPVANPPPNYFPLAIWIILTLLLTAANSANELLPAAIFGLLATVAVAAFAWRNSRR
jgi:uncharacterized membrane protein